MNWFLAIPREARLALLALLGLAIGSLANAAVYRLAWIFRPIGPWLPPPAEAPPRRWTDRLPVVGWLGLRREAGLHGRGYWVRPMLVELLFAAGLPLLYWWEVLQQGLLPPAAPALPQFVPHLHAEFLCHVVLFWLLLVASLLDIDDRVIPDSITVPGTLLGLAAAILYPWSMLPVPWLAPGYISFGFLTLVSPNLWVGWKLDLAQPSLLAVAIGCWWLWCIALMNRPWRRSRGWRRAFQVMWARMTRTPSTYWLLLAGVLGSLVIAAAWGFGSQDRWIALLSALVGMAGAGVLIWTVRLLVFASLREEGMGFGDVTLMFMLGAFLGWQTCLMVFFLAPVIGVVWAMFRLVVHREWEIYYGPFLCAAAVLLVVFWEPVWTWATIRVFFLGWLIPATLLVCMAMLPPLLLIARGLRRLVFGDVET